MTCEKYDTLLLLSYVAGDLTEDKRAEIVNHLRECSDCRAGVETAEKEKSFFLKEFPEVPEHSFQARKMVRFTPLKNILSLAAVLLIAIGIHTKLVRKNMFQTTIKGAVTLQPFVLDKSGQPEERKNSEFVAGERIQFTYSCGREHFIILLSIDTSGKVSVYYPAEGDSSMAVEPGRDLPLPHSIQLDDYIGKELYVAVFSALPLQVTSVIAKVKAACEDVDDLHSARLTLDEAVVKMVPIIKRRYSDEMP